MRTLITTDAEYDDMLWQLHRASLNATPVAVDTETTGLRLYQGDVVRGISIAVQHAPEQEVLSWYLPLTHPGSTNFDPARLIFALNQHQGLQVFHHALFDWKALVKADWTYQVPERFYDTQVAAWLLDENVRLGLKEQGAMLFGEDAAEEQRHLRLLKKGRSAQVIYRELREDPAWKLLPAAEARAEAKRLALLSRKDWDTFTAEDIWEYACKDTELTLRLMDSQVGPVAGWRLGSEFHRALAREHRFQGVLFRMMATGIRVDRDKADGQLHLAEHEAFALSQKFDGVNLNSTPQLRKLVYEDWGAKPKHFTRKGEPSTARAALEELEGVPGVRDLLEYRRLTKAIGTYYRPLLDTIAEDGRVHPVFSSTRTVTGRLSCSDPNLMTIPRGDTLVGVRDVFVPEPGYELWEYDLAQAELRVQASFCQDPTLMQALKDGADLHSMTATMVFGPEFTGLQRRLAKNLNFGFSYGIGPRKFATYMVAGTPNPVTQCGYWDWSRFDSTPRPRACGRCHVCQAAEILDQYRQAYPNLVRLMNGLSDIADRDGIIPLHVPGRYRHFRSPGVRVPGYTALNAIVQGGVAEFMKDVMIAAEPELADMGARLCIQVHDSLVIEVLPGDGPRVQKLLQGIADDLNPFDMPMLFEGAPWEAHD